ncbi:potassium channel protein [bacterium]|nr:MAG: potassium channel protein [bacterium]
MSPGTYTRRLYLAESGPTRTLLRRAGLVAVIMVLAWLMLWATRDGLRDNGGHPLGVLDVLYFAVVTVTTLGYGDIVPVSPMARGIITFGITPLRLVVWVLLLTTAYEFVLRRSIERFEMNNLKRTLNGHVVICGFGVKGRSAAKELLERGTPPGQIIVIDQSSSALEEANRLGLNFLLGNATTEQILRDAAIEKAGHAILVPNNDEACVLICLTIRELAPRVMIRAAAREEENVKLIRRSGANTVVAPSVSGGRLLASATTSPWSTDVMEQLFEHGRGADMYDEAVTEGHLGLTPKEVGAKEGTLILAVRTRAGEMLGFRDALHRPLERGDTMIAFSPPHPESSNPVGS